MCCLVQRVWKNGADDEDSLGHFFNASQTLDQKLGLAGGSYELLASIPEVPKYLQGQGWDGMVQHETELQETLLAYLRSKPGKITIYGVPESE